MIFGVRVEELEEAIAQEGERSDDIGVFASGFVLEQASVFAPVIADFDSAPVATDEAQPLFGRIPIDALGTEIIAGCLVFGFFEGGGIPGDADHGLDVREIDIARIDGAQRDGT